MEEKSREWRKGLFICRDNLVRKVWIKGLAAKHLHLVFIWCVGFLLFCRRRNIRGLKDFRDICKIRVMYDIGECIKSNFSKSDIGMPVFCGSRNIFTVINVKDGNLIFPIRRSNSSITSSKWWMISYPLSLVWQVSKQTLSLSLYTTPS